MKITQGLLIVFLIGLASLDGLSDQTVQKLPELKRVSTISDQKDLTPKDALSRLEEGNNRFVNSTMKHRDYFFQAKNPSAQSPWAVVLNCMDSRSVPELIFDQGLADLFVIRVQGNVLNDDILGSMEFATKAGSKLILVLAHTSCEAVADACNDLKLDHLDSVLNKIQPSVVLSKQETGEKDCNKSGLLDGIAVNNATSVARQISVQSPFIRELVKKGDVMVVAAIQDVKTGRVNFLNLS